MIQKKDKTPDEILQEIIDNLKSRFEFSNSSYKDFMAFKMLVNSFLGSKSTTQVAFEMYNHFLQQNQSQEVNVFIDFLSKSKYEGAQILNGHFIIDENNSQFHEDLLEIITFSILKVLLKKKT